MPYQAQLFPNHFADGPLCGGNTKHVLRQLLSNTFACVGSTITMFARVQTPSLEMTMLT
jgi:hypothetical protein